MIVSCPSCATHYDLPGDKIASDGSVIRCASCGHSWLEASAVEVIETQPAQLPAALAAQTALPAPVVDEDGYELEIEALRLTKVALAADRQHTLARERKRAQTRGWYVLSGTLAATLAGLFVFPHYVVKYAPGAARLYETAGMTVNVRGFEIRNIQQQNLVNDGTRVLAVRGEVKNIMITEKKAPALRFILRDKDKREVYAWTLNAVATRALKPDETTSFTTRVASPPETADDLQIRFAHASEIGSNAQP